MMALRIPVCFLAQQSVEKALKGFLVLNDIKPERTHNIIALADEAKKYLPDIKNYQDDIVSLNIYYIPSRYPVDPTVEYTLDDARSALKIASNLIKLISSKI